MINRKMKKYVLIIQKVEINNPKLFIIELQYNFLLKLVIYKFK